MATTLLYHRAYAHLADNLADSDYNRQLMVTAGLIPAGYRHLAYSLPQFMHLSAISLDAGNGQIEQSWTVRS